MEKFTMKPIQRALYALFAFAMGVVLAPAIPLIFAYYALYDREVEDE